MNAGDIPIDIHYNKLLDWLIDRRHCQQQWQGAGLVIREKINEAIQDMPAVDEITQLLLGTYINYFHCQKIIELLKSTDDGSKNMFGRYSSQRMKDWMEILRCYEDNGTYLAEAAQMLMRNVNYEIPALKRHQAKCQQIQKDCTRKEAEYTSSAAEMKDKYHSSCRHIGIKGVKVRLELVDLVQDLPTFYSKLESELHALQPATTYYTAFVTFMLSSSNRKPNCLPLLKHFLEKGNTTTYEWHHGKVPSRIEEPLRDYGIVEEEVTGDAETDEIDWGDTGEIDFGESEIGTDGATSQNDEGVSSDGGIDWGSDGTAAAIEILDDSTLDLANSSDDDVARGSEALSILDNTETRNSLINQLLELESFLTQRVEETIDGASAVTANQLHAAPQEVQLDGDVVQGMLGNVSQIVAQLTSKKMRDLFLIRSSPRYVDRIAEGLKKVLSDAEKLSSLARLMATHRQEAIEDEKHAQPKIDLLRTRTHTLKKQIEEEISKKYKGRRVNIMGEINTI